MLMWLLFFFVAFGSKVLLATVMIYLLFPSDRTCSACDGETVALRPGPFGRVMQALLLGAIQRRWCPRCGWEGTARTGRLSRTSPALTDAERSRVPR